MERCIIKVNKIMAYDQLEVTENNGLLVGNGKVQKIYDNISQVEIPEQTNVIDYGDKVIIPGIIDCHSRLTLDVRLRNHLTKMGDCKVEQTVRVTKAMKDDLVAGVTTSRCLGDRFYIDVTCKKAQKEGRAAGSKPVVSDTGTRNSHGRGCVGIPHCGAEDFRRTSRESIACGVDFLKVFMTKVINATPFVYHFLALKELRTMAEETKSVSITTACYYSGGQGLDDCSTAGVDYLEHVHYIAQSQVERVKRRDRWVVYTSGYTLNDQLLFKFSPHDRGGSLCEKGIICKYLSDAIEDGLKFDIGTSGLHQGLAQEACYISGLGVKNRDVLAGTTINAAQICGVDESIGSIAEGKAAGFAALEGNPLDDIGALKRVASVIQDGIVIF